MAIPLAGNFKHVFGFYFFFFQNISVLFRVINWINLCFRYTSASRRPMVGNRRELS